MQSCEIKTLGPNALEFLCSVSSSPFRFMLNAAVRNSEDLSEQRKKYGLTPFDKKRREKNHD